jgi:hypothetical protein
MNSFPLISHRLFVAAIGNESRLHERPRLLEQSSVEVPERAVMLALAAADEAMTMRSVSRPYEASTLRPRA